MSGDSLAKQSQALADEQASVLLIVVLSLQASRRPYSADVLDHPNGLMQSGVPTPPEAHEYL
jgi:hypothetical protein